VSVAELDAMAENRAAELLTACCGSSRWVAAMLARRPIRSRNAVFASADEIWKSLEPSDWQEAFAYHPRIGEPTAGLSEHEGSGWAAGEQSCVERAGYEVREELGRVNREYEQRFGHIYIVSATGKSADEMLALARERLRNEPAVELEIAAEEQRKITRLRLDKLLKDEEAA
jgi:OHCU decarboxylase